MPVPELPPNPDVLPASPPQPVAPAPAPIARLVPDRLTASRLTSPAPDPPKRQLVARPTQPVQPAPKPFNQRLAELDKLRTQVLQNPDQFSSTTKGKELGDALWDHRETINEALATGHHDTIFGMVKDLDTARRSNVPSYHLAPGDRMAGLALESRIARTLSHLAKTAAPEVREQAGALIERAFTRSGPTTVSNEIGEVIGERILRRMPTSDELHQEGRPDTPYTETPEHRLSKAASYIGHLRTGALPALVDRVREITPDLPEDRYTNFLNTVLNGPVNSYRNLFDPLGLDGKELQCGWFRGYDEAKLPDGTPDKHCLSITAYRQQGVRTINGLEASSAGQAAQIAQDMGIVNFGRFNPDDLGRMHADLQNPKQWNVLQIAAGHCGNGAILGHVEAFQEEARIAWDHSDDMGCTSIEAPARSGLRTRLEQLADRGVRFAGVFFNAHCDGDTYFLGDRTEPEHRLTREDCADWLGPLLGKITIPDATIISTGCRSALGYNSLAQIIHEQSGRRVQATTGATTARISLNPYLGAGMPPLPTVRFRQTYAKDNKWYSQPAPTATFEKPWGSVPTLQA